MELFDLHIHSNLSDGELNRKELLKKAIEMEMIVLSFTDHNYFQKVSPDISQQGKLEIISGIEIDCGLPQKIHILGYFISDEVKLNKTMIKLQEENNDICLRIIDNLRKTHNLKITDEDILLFKKKYLTKRNIIQILLEKGYVKNVSEAKIKYTGSETKGYIPIKKMHAKKVIELIKECGGVPVFAHPNTIFDKINISDFEPLLKDLISYGLEGLETINLKEGLKYKEKLEHLAMKYNLITTAGSDFHNFERDEFGVHANEEQYLYPLLRKRR